MAGETVKDLVVLPLHVKFFKGFYVILPSVCTTESCGHPRVCPFAVLHPIFEPEMLSTACTCAACKQSTTSRTNTLPASCAGRAGFGHSKTYEKQGLASCYLTRNFNLFLIFKCCSLDSEELGPATSMGRNLGHWECSITALSLTHIPVFQVWCCPAHWRFLANCACALCPPGL